MIYIGFAILKNIKQFDFIRNILRYINTNKDIRKGSEGLNSYLVVSVLFNINFIRIILIHIKIYYSII